MPSRRAILCAALAGGCAAPLPPARPLGEERVTVSAESWHTDLCLPAGALGGTPLASVPGGGVRAIALGFGLERWMRAARPGSAEALAALGGGPALVWLRALSGPVPDTADEAVPLRLPTGGTAAIARFVAGQLTVPLPVAMEAGAAALLPSRLAYAPDFTCNTWVLKALAEAGLPVPVAGIRFRRGTMAAIHAEAERQARV